MLVLIGDWYRTVEPVPGDDLLERRRASAERLITAWEKATAAVALDVVALVTGLVAEMPAVDDLAPTLDVVVDAMTRDQPSLNRSNVRGSIDPKLCAATAVGELLSRATINSSARRTGVEAVFAGALASALRNRDLTAFGHAGKALSDLLGLAEGLLDGLDQRRRERRETATRRFDRATAADDVDLRKAVKDLVSGLNEEMLKDREELQALWWVFGGYSYKASERYELLPLADAALYAGMELAEIVQPPATKGIAALTGRVVCSDGITSPTTVQDLLRTVAAGTWADLKPKGPAADLVRRHASLFPITQMSLRAKASDRTEMIEIPTGAPVMSLDLVTDPGGLARQAYAESALLRSVRGD